MKNIILSIFLLASVNAFAQDSTIILNLSLQARLMEYLTPQLQANVINNLSVNLTDASQPVDKSYTLFLKWRAKFQATQPTGVTAVVVDTTGVIVLADLYNYTLGQADGMGASALMKAQIASARSSNTFLDRLCTAYENNWTSQLISLRLIGRRYLLGKQIVP